MMKLLVADPSAEFCVALSDALGGTFEIRVCHDGVEAVALLDTFRPDVMVLDLALPGMDGITVLKTAACSAHRPAVLVTTRILSAYIERMLETVGVDYLVVKPCDMRSLADRIHDLAGSAGGVVFFRPVPAVTAANMLLALDLSTKRRGFGCLETAIMLFMQDPEQSVTKVLYPAVARIRGGSRESVERAIRAVIHEAWYRRDEKTWRLYFQPDRNGHVARPTNTAFISKLAGILKRQYQEMETQCR